MGIKIVATGLEKALAGTGIMVVGPEDDVEDIKEEVMRDITDVMGHLETDSRGVTVQASTLGALEALLEYLRKECKPPVPVARVGIGPIFKKDVTQTGTNIEKGLREYACILAFDVKVDAEARQHADELGVRIFTAEIIYHLFDQFSNYIKVFQEEKKEKAMATAVFPVVCKIMPQHIFNAKDPIIVGVEVSRGILRIGTPLVVTVGGLVELGVVTSIQSNHKELQQVGKGTQAAIKIECEKNPNIMFGRHFTAEHPLYSRISRESIDALKSHFKDELTNDDWRLVIDLKKVFGIV
ncbi:translation initiation factor aif-2 [Nannochloropsis oceanica]